MTQVGDFIDNRYRVVDKIGEGGMSEVWLVNDQRLNKMQAVKEIKKNAKTETHHVLADRIKIEADIMRRLEHPNIVKVIDYIDDGRSLYIVMDYIQGRDLLTVMKKRLRNITEEDVVDWGIQLCDALGYLHTQGIIYRDMKPGNIMLLDDGTVKIIDFGIAREYSPDKEDDTMPLGTRGYASPEAFKRGAQTDARSDIYSLGVTLFHLVTGHGPMEFVEQPTLPPIRTINPALSEGLEYVILRATQWNPAERYQSCNEMRYDLEHLDLLTRDHRRSLQRVMTLFKVFAIAGIVCLALGIGCLVASNLVRGSSFDGIMASARSASTTEGSGGTPSEAESLYTQAIEIMPANPEPYLRLVNSYPTNDMDAGVCVRDSAFSTSEASRCARLVNDNQGNIGQSNEYAKICYYLGSDYFFFYDYGTDLTSSAQAVTWFDKAIENYEERNGDCTLTASEYNAARAYKTIGEFSRKLEQTTQVGAEWQTYEDYWDALQEAVIALGDDTPPLARLKLYDTIVQAIKSPTYLNGFANRANIEERAVKSLLQEVVDRTEALESEIASSGMTAELYEGIIDGASDAESNIASTYGNAGMKNQGSSSASSSSNGRGNS